MRPRLLSGKDDLVECNRGRIKFNGCSKFRGRDLPYSLLKGFSEADDAARDMPAVSRKSVISPG